MIPLSAKKWQFCCLAVGPMVDSARGWVIKAGDGLIGSEVMLSLDSDPHHHARHSPVG